MQQEKDIQLIQNDSFLQKAYHTALVPGILSILSGCVNIIVDGMLVGHRIGAGGLAAVNFCVPVYLLLCIIGSFLVSGAAICCSKEIGKSRMDRAGLFYRTAGTTCVIASVVITVVGVLLVGPIAGFLCSDPEVLPMVRAYTFVTLAGAFPKIMIYVPFWFLRLDGKNKSAALMMAIMAAGNVALDILFLYVFHMGVGGAAAASVIATAAACVFGFARQQSGPGVFKIGFGWPEKKDFRQMCAAGSPAALNNLFQALRLLCINSLLQSYGGSLLVAEFSVVNGISAFAEAVTVGVPQAGTAILGIYHGERDNESAGILLKLEARRGFWGCVLFGLCIVAGSGLIAGAYGLEISLRLPLLCLALSLFPALWNNILSTYYNVADRVRLSNMIIVMRVLVFAIIPLFLFLARGITPWLFLIAGEVLTVAAWFAVTGVMHRRNPMRSRFFLMDETLSKQGRVINFSIVSDPEKICGASERITSFCEENGMQAGQVIRISLALEEMLTLIAQVNEPSPVSFDIRVFAVQEEIGIRIRYDGKNYNPLTAAETADGADGGMYMGIRMIQKLMEEVIYQNTFGMNTLLLLL